VHSLEIRKVYINEDNTALLVCPHCGTSKNVQVAKYKGRKDPLKVRCTCRSAFHVLFEFRRAYRKQTNLHGDYSKLPACKQWGKMVVKNISLTGIGFSTLTRHNLRKDDELKVKFTLDDKRRSEIEKDVVVRLVEDTYIGCEFTERVQFDKVLGFYLMP
jgi:hypothetical protein